MTTSAPPQTATPVAPGSRQYAAFPLRARRYVVMVTTTAPSHMYEEARLQNMTRTLPYTTKYNSSLIVTELYKYSTQNLTHLLPCHVMQVRSHFVHERKP
jgi:hypothetical protein